MNYYDVYLKVDNGFPKEYYIGTINATSYVLTDTEIPLIKLVDDKNNTISTLARYESIENGDFPTSFKITLNKNY